VMSHLQRRPEGLRLKHQVNGNSVNSTTRRAARAACGDDPQSPAPIPGLPGQ
jgi:hypothetical protein